MYLYSAFVATLLDWHFLFIPGAKLCFHLSIKDLPQWCCAVS